LDTAKKETLKTLLAQVTGKRKREVGLVVTAKFTTELRIARLLDRELNGRAALINFFVSNAALI